MTKTDKPSAPYWHLWTDAEGVSHQTRCAIREFEKAAIQPHAAPQWIGARIKDSTTVFVTVLPVGWIGDWHENPKPQWIIPLSGRWFVESLDGQRVEMGRGEMSFGEDMHTCQIDGKHGHLSGTVGNEPAVLMIVQSNAAPTLEPACRFR